MVVIPYFIIENNFSIVLNTWCAGSTLKWTGAAGLSSPGVAPAPERVYSENKREFFCSSDEMLNNACRCVQERHIAWWNEVVQVVQLMQPMERCLCVLWLQKTAKIVMLLIAFSGRVLAACRGMWFGDLVTVGHMLETNTSGRKLHLKINTRTGIENGNMVWRLRKE